MRASTFPHSLLLRATRSTRQSLLAVAAIVLACGGGSGVTPPGDGSGDLTRTWTLREYGVDAGLPYTFHDDVDYKLDLTGGSLTLRDDHTFDLQLDFSMTINGQTQDAPWQASGQWSIPEPEHFELQSSDFGENGPVLGILSTVENGSIDIAHGNLRPGPAVVLPLRFEYLDGITYGVEAYTFQ